MKYQPPDTQRVCDAKRVILGIIAEAGGEFVGAGRLNKAFWLAHVLHWKSQDGVLTRYPIVKLKDGPGIDRREALINELHREGKLEISRYRLRGQKYTLVGEAPRLTPAERESISAALKTLGGRGYTAISKLSHDKSVSWNDAEMGEELDYMLDAMGPAEVQRIRDSFKKAKGDFELAFSGG